MAQGAPARESASNETFKIFCRGWALAVSTRHHSTDGSACGPVPVRKPVQTTLDHLAVPVVAESVDSSTASLQMLMGAVKLAELAITLAEVEVQGGKEGSHRNTTTSRAFVGKPVGCGERSQVPGSSSCTSSCTFANECSSAQRWSGRRSRRRFRPITGRTNPAPRSPCSRNAIPSPIRAITASGSVTDCFLNVDQNRGRHDRQGPRRCAVALPFANVVQAQRA
jgi:hypothetical protein